MTATPTPLPEAPVTRHYWVLLCALLVLGGFNRALVAFDMERWDAWAAMALSGTVVALLQLMLHYRLPMKAFALLPLALLLPQLDRSWANYWHGFMHISIVNEIFYRGGAENPLLAGEPLRYMHAHHAAIAWLMRMVPISAPQAFMLTDVIGLAVMVVFLDRTFRLASADRTYRVFAGVLALCAISPLLRGPLADIVEHEWFGKTFVYRVDPRFIPLMKFVGINNNQLGLTFSALAFYGLVLLVVRGGRSWPALGWVAAGLLGAGVFYPPCWASIAACAGAVGIYMLLQGRPELRRGAVLLGFVVALASAAVLPSMLGVTSGKEGSSSAIQIALNYRHLRQNGSELLLLLAPGALLAWWRRRTLSDWWRDQPQLAGALGSIAAIGLLLYLVTAIPGPSEYKFVHMGVFALSIPLALALGELHRSRPLLTLLLLALTSIPVTVDLVHQPPADRVLDPLHSVAGDLRHLDPQEDALYSWIAAQTPLDAVFLDTHLTIPVLAHRQLLVGTDLRRSATGFKQFEHDGWMITAQEFLTEITGVNPDVYRPAYDATLRVLAPTGGPVDAADLRGLAAIRAGRPCYVVARQSGVAMRLDVSPGFRRVFANDAGSIYELTPTATHR